MNWKTSTTEEAFGRKKKEGTSSSMVLLYSINILCTGSFLNFYSEVSRVKKIYPCNRPWRSIWFLDFEASTIYVDNRFTDGDVFQP
jgi:hypothetical protein